MKWTLVVMGVVAGVGLARWWFDRLQRWEAEYLWED